VSVAFPRTARDMDGQAASARRATHLVDLQHLLHVAIKCGRGHLRVRDHRWRLVLDVGNLAPQQRNGAAHLAQTGGELLGEPGHISLVEKLLLDILRYIC
jgi:hypothetical protein